MKHKKKKKGMNPSGMRCQYCGGTVVLRSADGIYHDNSRNTMLYVCSNYPQCDAYVRTHPGTTIPVGTLANHELRTLRNRAHHYFDQLYSSGRMSKQDAYLWLADLLQVPLSKAHIGFLGEYYCTQVIEESQKLLDRQRPLKNPCFARPQGGVAAS
jgi:ssDNA-binding Zn-finger/Zn-ribbon topoisomerase 1